MTHERLLEALDYNPVSGVFTWKTRGVDHFKTLRDCKAWNSNFAGKRAGSYDPRGYRIICIDLKAYHETRLSYFYVNGVWPPYVKDDYVTRPKMTAEYLKTVLSYDRDTGIFTWLRRPSSHFRTTRCFGIWNTRYSGREAGVTSDDGYIKISIDGKVYMAHRLAWLYVTGSWPEKFIDHKTSLSNAFDNLREVDHSENGQNQRKPSVKNTSGFLGVSHVKSSGRYRATICTRGVSKRLGHFATAEEAYEAYLAAKRLLHPTCTL